MNCIEGVEEAKESSDEKDKEILAYLKYKKSEASKNSTNSGSNSKTVGRITRQRSIGTGEQIFANENKQNVRSIFGVHFNKYNDKYSDKKFRSNEILSPVKTLKQNA
ncbi:hypothetical protein GLOIN_2v1487149 [Rhizophagus clarus]|uniref:Uncharacterized protein n=1 Tax=Rhizophagus clarus TaxID=94130 RepID=A0A8H3QM02_9GLOM|nr:hypothetical protein GLOIN_2v1487149 [Rhizophagus clarus]